MSDSSNPISKRKPPTPPAWLITSDGRKKNLEKGRWSVERVSEVFTDEPAKNFTVDDLARLVYGTTGKKNRENVRRHIPIQRTYMLSRLAPIITRYGSRGRILAVKLYEKEIPEDRRSMRDELDRLRSRKELTEERYQHMCGVLGLVPDGVVS